MYIVQYKSGWFLLYYDDVSGIQKAALIDPKKVSSKKTECEELNFDNLDSEQQGAIKQAYDLAATSQVLKP
jgi:hypothetical protein